jgi:dihydroorotate dehydrogenase
VIDARERVRKNAGDSPVLLKIADLSLSGLDDVVHRACPASSGRSSPTRWRGLRPARAAPRRNRAAVGAAATGCRRA